MFSTCYRELYRICCAGYVGIRASDYTKLFTFPVFIIAVIIGGSIIKSGRPIPFIEGIILVLAGLLPILISTAFLGSDGLMYTQVMLAIFAMGL